MTPSERTRTILTLTRLGGFGLLGKKSAEKKNMWEIRIGGKGKKSTYWQSPCTMAVCTWYARANSEYCARVWGQTRQWGCWTGWIRSARPEFCYASWQHWSTGRATRVESPANPARKMWKECTLFIYWLIIKKIFFFFNFQVPVPTIVQEAFSRYVS